MMLAAALALLVQAVEEPAGGALPALRFLARHQRDDGSWGEAPKTCTCPKSPEGSLSPKDPAEMERLVRALGQDSPDDRAKASDALRSLGQRALPHLLEGIRDPDPEIRNRCAALRRDLHPYAPGAGDVEVTGLAILAFLGAGYSNYSKDIFDGLCFGTVVKKALLWLLSRQLEMGSFDPKDSVADTIAALALSECFAMTGCPRYKADAGAAVLRVAGREMGDTRGVIWKGMLLKSAELAELPVERKVARENLEGLRKRPADSLQRAGLGILSIFVEKRQDAPDLDGLRLLDPFRLDAETLYLATIAMFQFDGPRGPLWSDWSSQYKPYLLPLQARARKDCAWGSWTGVGFRGRLRATALSVMNFEIYYHY